MADDIDLTGTRALVTGGTSGLGLAMAEALALAGAAVALTSRSAERAEAAAARLPGTGAIGIAADARDEAAVTRAVGQAWSRLGGIDLLVNNAGLGMKTVNPRFMTEPLGFWQVPFDGFQAVLGTNASSRSISPNGCKAEIRAGLFRREIPVKRLQHRGKHDAVGHGKVYLAPRPAALLAPGLLAAEEQHAPVDGTRAEVVGPRYRLGSESALLDQPGLADRQRSHYQLPAGRHLLA